MRTLRRGNTTFPLGGEGGTPRSAYPGTPRSSRTPIREPPAGGGGGERESQKPEPSLAFLGSPQEPASRPGPRAQAETRGEASGALRSRRGGCGPSWSKPSLSQLQLPSLRPCCCWGRGGERDQSESPGHQQAEADHPPGAKRPGAISPVKAREAGEPCSRPKPATRQGRTDPGPSPR